MAEEKRKTSFNMIVLAFIIATLIFSAGFLLSYMITYFKYQSIEATQNSIRYDILSIDLEKQLLASSCNTFNPYELSLELDNMGSMIGILEERFGKNDNKVIEQKKIYSILEIQHMLLIKEFNEKCDEKIPIILFFYSNKENFINAAEKTGFILSSFKTNNQKTMIYSFDYDLEINLINILKKKYEIEKPNTIIINEKMKLVDIQNIEEIERLLS